MRIGLRISTKWLFALALIVVSAASLPAKAAGVGIVYLHSRSSWPTQFDALSEKLQPAGIGAVAPNLCWSVRRLYEGTPDTCMADIDAAVNELKGKGYDKIILAGHELGGLMAFYYAAKHKDLAGVIVWTPVRTRKADDDIVQALNLAKQGQGDKKASFANSRVFTTPNALLAFDGPESVLTDDDYIPKIGAPLLWIASNDDNGPRDPTARFNLAPKNPLNTLVRMQTDLFSMVDLSADPILAWVNKLKAQ